MSIMLLKLIFFPIYIATSSVKPSSEWMKQTVVDVVGLTNEIHDELVSSKRILEELRESTEGSLRALIQSAIVGFDEVMNAQIRNLIRPLEFYYLVDLGTRIYMMVDSCNALDEALLIMIRKIDSEIVKSRIKPIIANWSTLLNKGRLILTKVFDSSLEPTVRIARNQVFNVVSTTTTAPAAATEMSLEEALLFIEGDNPASKKKSTKKKATIKSTRGPKTTTLTTSQPRTTVSATSTSSAPTTTTTESQTTKTTTARTTTRTTNHTTLTTTRPTTTRSTPTTTRATTTHTTLTTSRATTIQRTRRLVAAPTVGGRMTTTENGAPIRKILQRGEQPVSLEDRMTLINNPSDRASPDRVDTITTITDTVTIARTTTTEDVFDDGVDGAAQIEMQSGPSVVGHVTLFRQPVVNIVSQMWELSEAIMGLSDQLGSPLALANCLIPIETPLRIKFDHCTAHIHNAHMAIMNMALSVRGLRDLVNMLPVYAVQSYSVIPQIEQRYLRERRDELERVPAMVPSVPLTPVFAEIREFVSAMLRLADQLASLRTQACAVAPDAAVVENIYHCTGAILQAQTAIDNVRMAVNTLIHTFNEYEAVRAAHQRGNSSSMNRDS